MAARTGPKNLYNLRGSQADPMVGALRAVGLFIFLSLFAVWAATELAAMQFGWQRQLGAPLAAHIYEPWGGIRWALEFRGIRDPRVMSINGWFWKTWGIGEIVALVVAVAIGLGRSFRKEEANDLHGSAHWATEEEIKKTGLVASGNGGVYVGAWEDKRGRIKYLRHDGPEHILAFAPTRSGKGVGLVIPTLLSWPGSVVVHDIKGENYALTSGWRARDLNSRIFKFDPTSIDPSTTRFNPLVQVRVGTDFEIKDTQNIVGMLADPEGKGGSGEESHWIATSSALLLGVVLHVLYSERDKSLAGVANFLSDPSFESPQQMYEYMLNTVHDPDLERGWVDVAGRPTSTHPVVAMSARDMLNKDPKEATSVLSTAIRFLTLFRDPIVARNTSSTDFKIEDLMQSDRPVSLYLIVPPSDIDRLKPLTRLVMNQILRTLTSEMKFDGGRSVANYKHRLLMMIDELPSLGRLDILQTALAYMAGYGIKAYLITQDVSQLNAAYGGSSGRDEAIMANCHVQIAYAPNKLETMELISKLAGTATVRNETRSFSGSRVGVRSQVMVNSQETQRPLLTPDEARRLPADDALVFIAGHSPIYGKKIKYYSDPTFSVRAKVPAAAPETSRAAVTEPAHAHV